jgi:hypothetical protein
MPQWHLTRLIVIFSGLFLTCLVSFIVAAAGPETAYIGLVRIFDVDDIGAQQSFGLAHSSSEDLFIVIDEADNDLDIAQDSVQMTAAGKFLSVMLSPTLDIDPHSITFDPSSNTLYLLDRNRQELVQVPLNFGRETSVKRFPLESIGLSQAQAITFDPNSGQVIVLNGAKFQLFGLILDTSSHPAAFVQGQLNQRGLQELENGFPRSIALDPSANHLFILSASMKILLEVTSSGQTVSTYDVSFLGLENPTGMTMAPSSDSTDDPSTMGLFINDNGQLLELSFIEPTVVAPQALLPSSLVNIIDTSAWSPASPDPAGIQYLPSAGELIVSDSEVNEMPIFTGKNMYQTTTAGALTNTYNSESFSNEPTGLGWNQTNGHLFVSDDTGTSAVYEVDLGPDGNPGTADDTVHTIRTNWYGSDDPEGVAYGQGRLFIADGVDDEVYVINPGLNGVFDGTLASGGDDQLTSFDTTSLGASDPEGIDYSQLTGTLFIVSQLNDVVLELSPDGTVINTIDITFLDSEKAAGIAMGPRSTNPAEMSLYIVDRGVDNGADPKENDGRIFEITYEGVTGPTTTPTSSPIATTTNTPGPTPTATPTSTPSLTPTASPTPIPGDRPQVDSVSTGSTNGKNLVVSHRTSGSDGLMLVGVSINNENYETVKSVTYDGISLTYVKSATQFNDARVEIWGLVNPPLGTHDVLITFDADLQRIATAGVITFKQVDQAYPLGAIRGKADQSDAGSLTIPSTKDSLVFAVFTCETCTSVTYSYPASERWNLMAGNGQVIGAAATQTDYLSPITMNTTLGTSDDWAIVAVSIRLAGSTPPSPTPEPTPSTQKHKLWFPLISS